MQMAAQNGFAEIVKELLTTEGKDLNLANLEGDVLSGSLQGRHGQGS
jgi:hypothetical protein